MTVKVMLLIASVNVEDMLLKMYVVSVMVPVFLMDTVIAMVTLLIVTINVVEKMNSMNVMYATVLEL